MDEDRVKGAATNVVGKIKDAVGGLTGDTEGQAEGKADEAKGALQQKFGAAKDTVRDSVASLGEQLDSLMQDRPLTPLLIAGAVGYALAFLIHRR